jgi:hypothetical protein
MSIIIFHLTFFLLEDLGQLAPEAQVGKQVTLRGFPYQNEGEWVLASEPNIPSCCLKKQSYLRLEGAFPHLPTSRAIEVTGQLTYDKGWILKDGKLKEASHWSLEWVLPILAVIAFLFFLIRKRIIKLLE